MRFVVGLKCTHCGHEYLPEQVIIIGPKCGYHEGILDVIYDYQAVETKSLNPTTMATNRERSMSALSTLAACS